MLNSRILGRRMRYLNNALKQTALVLMALTVPVGVTAQGVDRSLGTPDRQDTPPLSADRPLQIAYPVIELFAGYSYLPELDARVRSFADPGNGFAANFTVNRSRHVGLSVDFDAHSWTVHGRGVGSYYVGDQDITLLYLSIGPRFVVRANRLTTFGLATLDIQRSHFSAITLSDPDSRRIPPHSAGAWGFGFGGGVDISLARYLAVRAVQVNYSLGGFGGGPGRELRLKSGLVFKF